MANFWLVVVTTEVSRFGSVCSCIWAGGVTLYFYARFVTAVTLFSSACLEQGERSRSLLISYKLAYLRDFPFGLVSDFTRWSRGAIASKSVGLKTNVSPLTNPNTLPALALKVGYSTNVLTNVSPMSQQVLTPEQARMVSMLCQGLTNTAISEAIGVCRKTIIRWHKLPHIQEAIAQASSRQTEAVAKEQGEQYKQLTKSAQAATTEIVERLLPHAVKVVGRILADGEARTSDRLKAAELLSKWGGLGQQNTTTTQQTSAEQTLSLYINNIAANQSLDKN